MADSKLYEFLRGLNEDSTALAAFEDNPEKAMADAGLSQDEQEAVKSGNEEQILKSLGGDEEGLGAFRVIRIRNIRIRFGV